jgi:hypothetical protein
MIGNLITNDEGIPEPLLTKKFNAPDDVKKLWEQVRQDYFQAYALQNRPFEEFDMLSLLQRMNLDQQTWGAFVGATYSAADQTWRWKGRKNTARNKIIGILAHVVSSMLYPFVYAYNEDNEEDEMTARVMRLLIENHLKKTNYEDKFLFMMCSALVNPAVFAQVECVEALQKIKYKKDGKWVIDEVVDEVLTGIHLNIVPVDQMMLADFYTPDIQNQPYIIRVRRLGYDQARALYKGKYTWNGEDVFDYVRKGDMTQIVGAGRDYQTIYNIDWTLADQNFVQEITAYYKSDDLEVTFVGGVLMGNYDNVYNTNAFKKRRLTTNKKGEYCTMPVYPFAKTGFEPIDPNRRFAYYKSAAFKEFWDDASLNRAFQLAQDSSYLGAFPPSMITGVTNIESSIMVPGYTFGAPKDASLTPAFEQRNMPSLQFLMQQNTEDMSLSTQDALQQGVANPNVTATASVQAQQNAKIIMTVFATMIASLVKEIGQLYVDDILLHTTQGEVDATIPDKLKVKYRSIRASTKENGKDVNNIIQFEPNMSLPTFTEDKAKDLEWELFYKNGGMNAHTYTYIVNPYKFAKAQFNVYVDPQQIISRSSGTDQIRKERLLNYAMNPAIAPFINMKEVVDKLVIEELADGDPDKFKPDENQLANAMMGSAPQGTAGPMGAPGTLPPMPQMPAMAQ